MPVPVVFGEDGDGRRVCVSPEQRSMHLHVIGATGRGKSRFLEQLIRQDIRHRHGLCLIDPHGELFGEVVRWCARHDLQHRRRVHVIDPNDTSWTLGFDPLRCDDPEYLPRTVDSAVGACAQVWGGEDTSKTPLLKRCLRAIFFALVAAKRPFSDAMALTSASDTDGLRAELTTGLDDPIFQAVWDDLNAMSRREFTETFSSTNNRLLEFLASPGIRQMLSLREQALDVAQCMEQGDILLVNLQAQKISHDNARLIGTLLTNALFTAAVRRDPREAKRRPFYLYIDECYRFLTEDVESMLDETRKFGLHVTLSHQHLGQLRKYGEHVFNAVMTNTGTKVVFGGLPDEDAELMAKQILRPLFDFNRPKHILDKPSVVGFQKVLMRHQGRAEGVAVSQGSSSMMADMAGSSAAATQMFGADGLPIGGGTEIAGQTSGVTHGTGSSNATAHSTVTSQGMSEAWLPILETLPTAVESEAEILHRSTLAVRTLPRQVFILAEPWAPPQLVRTPDVSSPAVRPARIERFVADSRTASPYIVPAAVAAQQIAERAAPASAPDEDDDLYSVPVQ